MKTSPELIEEARSISGRRKAGRPKGTGKSFVRTVLDWESVELHDRITELTVRGLSDAQVAYCLFVSPATLQRKKSEIEEVSEALRRGRSIGVHKVANALYEKALGGDISAQKFYLQAVGGWRIHDQATVSSGADSAFEQVEKEMGAISAQNKKLLELAAKEGAIRLKNLEEGAVN